MSSATRFEDPTLLRQRLSAHSGSTMRAGREDRRRLARHPLRRAADGQPSLARAAAGCSVHAATEGIRFRTLV